MSVTEFIRKTGLALAWCRGWPEDRLAGCLLSLPGASSRPLQPVPPVSLWHLFHVTSDGYGTPKPTCTEEWGLPPRGGVWGVGYLFRASGPPASDWLGSGEVAN